MRLQVVVQHGPVGWVPRCGFLRRQRRTQEDIVVNANRRCRLKEPNVRTLRLARNLPQWRDVVENPERSSVRGYEQVIPMNGNVADGGHRQIQLQRLPVGRSEEQPSELQ